MNRNVTITLFVILTFNLTFTHEFTKELERSRYIEKEREGASLNRYSWHSSHKLTYHYPFDMIVQNYAHIVSSIKSSILEDFIGEQRIEACFLFEHLKKEDSNPLCLIGEKGIGKTFLIENFAKNLGMGLIKTSTSELLQENLEANIKELEENIKIKRKDKPLFVIIKNIDKYDAQSDLIEYELEKLYRRIYNEYNNVAFIFTATELKKDSYLRIYLENTEIKLTKAKKYEFCQKYLSELGVKFDLNKLAFRIANFSESGNMCFNLNNLKLLMDNVFKGKELTEEYLVPKENQQFSVANIDIITEFYKIKGIEMPNFVKIKLGLMQEKPKEIEPEQEILSTTHEPSKIAIITALSAVGITTALIIYKLKKFIQKEKQKKIDRNTRENQLNIIK